MQKKLTSKRLNECRKALMGSRDPAAALALYRHSMAMQQGWRACERFIVAKALGASFDDEDVVYQQNAWSALPEKTKQKVRDDAESFLTGIQQ